MTRDLTWLRGFLHLDALQQQEPISDTAIRLQEDTVIAALSILDREPGVLLADEVGMGKTSRRSGYWPARSRLLVGRTVSPTSSWSLPGRPQPSVARSARTFRQKEFYGGFPKDTFHEVGHITELPDATARHHVMFAPINVFTSARGHAERGFLLDFVVHTPRTGRAPRALRSGAGSRQAGRTGVRRATTFLAGQRSIWEAADRRLQGGTGRSRGPPTDLYNSDGARALANAWRK